MRDPHFHSAFRVQKWSRKVSILNCDILSYLLFPRRRSPRIARLIASPIIPNLVSLLLSRISLSPLLSHIASFFLICLLIKLY